MSTVALKPLAVAPTPDGYVYYDAITFTPGSPPERPHPGPRPPDPNAPRPSHPIALPGDPWWGQDLHPSHPIMLPGMPGWPEQPKPPETPGPGMSAIVIPLPPSDPPAKPPEGMAQGSFQVLIYFGPGTKPALAWVNPYPSTGPVTPPAEGTTPPANP